MSSYCFNGKKHLVGEKVTHIFLPTANPTKKLEKKKQNTNLNKKNKIIKKWHKVISFLSFLQRKSRLNGN